MAKIIPWHGMRDAMIWHSLPLTAKLGIPLQYTKYLTSGPCALHSSHYVNQTVGFLTVDVDPQSDSFGEPRSLIHEDVIFTRTDCKDLDSKRLEAVEGFVRCELGPLLIYGASTITRKDVASHTTDLDDDVGSPINTSSMPDHAQKSFPTPSEATRAQAEEVITKIDPTTFAAFFERYRAKRAAAHSDWRSAVNSIQPPTCEACNALEVEDGSLLVCGGCQLVKYCGEYSA
ncbi:hypothetical protein Slin15195_G085780 [Septoria linicola]|uniref:Uncharacterized protein n=1 Tax=Septoria linicola TaxID=215465 RepID=A0A9Q9EMA3_9PEZI|nr:hypothetical protein Slin14017_G088370 [Septoria linicola]USW55259.1 hypothetical protein Slin15195_G085780 [Septoria linicola]